MHGGGVADILAVGLTDVGLAHEVDEHLGGFLVLAGGGHSHAVHRKHTALLREHPSQVRVIIDHGNGIAGVVHADGSLAADHLIKDLIHDVGLHQRFLRLELFYHLVHLLRGGGVDAVAALERSDGVGIAAVVEHQDVARILFVPQVCPAGGSFVYHGSVVDDAGGAQHIGYGVGVLRVVIRVAVFRIDLLEVGDVVVIQGLQHPLRDHLGHHVVGRDDDVERRAAGLELGVHRLVGIKGQVVDLDAGLFLEGRDDIEAVVRAVGDVLAPVIDVQGDVLPLEAGPVVSVRHRDVLGHLDSTGGKYRQCGAQRHSQRQQQCSNAFHHAPSSRSVF